MTAKTLQDIINIDSSKISISDFIDFLKNVDMEFPTPSANKEYILYAGKIGDQPISRAFLVMKKFLMWQKLHQEKH